MGPSVSSTGGPSSLPLLPCPLPAECRISIMPIQMDRVSERVGESGMAEDRYAAPAPPRERWQFINLFRTFRVALDPKKLLLAAAGIVVMAFGWWLLSVIFYSVYSQPNTTNYQIGTEKD